ncbi:Rhomboid-like protein [Thalictrum thalictroides]|uniref:Rhomboid-like protein n=1 Tax=Thalictrum thalictroides TaxID=46969 RepID=A0A7J6V9A5_THATH|nr:Rhomboid-like protein [Thalictrum thalictroides]
MNGGPSGFHNAPVTRVFVIASALLTILFGFRGRSSKLGLSYQDVFGRLRIWKLFTSVFAFSSTPELMFGLYLLYYFRVFERQIGSNKYSVFILFSVIVSSLFEIVALAFLKDPSLNLVASGPYGLVFSSFVPFFFDIPVSTRFRIFGINFSDKSFVYIAGLQLLLSSWKRSILPGVCGVLAGAFFRLNLFGIRKMKFPEFITSFFSRLSWPTVGGSPPSASSGNVIGSIPSYRGREVEASIFLTAFVLSILDFVPASIFAFGNYASAAPITTTAEPSESSIATLISMGFDRNSARQALVQARNDVNVATNILLEAQSH